MIHCNMVNFAVSAIPLLEDDKVRMAGLAKFSPVAATQGECLMEQY
jgi:hypothetical protein